ncbi:MAG: hypothetical protein IKM59_06800 [Oscillospiraceae bacterium]|nr:hypothetical protein [Oscillospiraceae bacterium]
MENTVEANVIEAILNLYGFSGNITEQTSYIHVIEEDGWMKLIFRATLEDGQRLILKILHEDEDLSAEMEKVENQSIFSEQMRTSGIRTPKRYQAKGRYCNKFIYHALPCLITVEDWCGEEMTEINTEIACQIGELMAQMHTLSLEQNCKIGSRTLFSAAYWNDVDAFPDFCEITKNENLDQETVAKIKALREEKLNRLRDLWNSLPKVAVQGDVSINNLVPTDDGLIIFDYNNAGDEVLVSDLVMEGLLTAYEMDLPPNAPDAYTEQLFSAFLKGYLSVRTLSELECAAAWDIYTLYHGLWFTRIVYKDSALDALVKEKNYEAANRLLNQMLSDMEEANDGRFNVGKGRVTMNVNKLIESWKAEE